MTRAVWAGALYFGCVFAVGFVLGTARVLVVAPRLGELLATLVELPVILVAAWLISLWLTRWLAVPREPAARWVMGSIAFALLMVAEAVLAAALLGVSLGEHVGRYRQLPEAIGLAGQVAFALLPLAQLRHA